ncbi:MAG: hypothetical protein FWD92_06465 [Methanomassiliicoccaceae archaeon]|nr:hypothetical protein [Methanomassiliicoccaceae archaeon]
MENTASVGLLEFALFIVMPLAVIFLVLMYMASKVGNAYATALFAFVVAALIAVQSAVGGVEGSSFALYVIAIFFILFALVAFFIGAPKLLSIQLFFTALLYLFVGLFLAADDGKTMALIFGVFGVLASAVATYMALALAQEKVKLPMF